jgi:hypothetical protein
MNLLPLCAGALRPILFLPCIAVLPIPAQGMQQPVHATAVQPAIQHVRCYWQCTAGSCTGHGAAVPATHPARRADGPRLLR